MALSRSRLSSPLYLLEEHSTTGYYRPLIAIDTRMTHAPVEELCKPRLSQDEAHLLRSLRAIERSCTAYADWTGLSRDRSSRRLRGPKGLDRVYAVADDLKRKGLIGMSAAMGTFVPRPCDVPWPRVLRKQGDTLEPVSVIASLPRGDYHVEFTRELTYRHQRSKGRVRERRTALATTQASGDRWLIVALTRRRGHGGSAGSQDYSGHLEQLLSQTPICRAVRCSIVTTREGLAKLQVFARPLEDSVRR